MSSRPLFFGVVIDPFVSSNSFLVIGVLVPYSSGLLSIYDQQHRYNKYLYVLVPYSSGLLSILVIYYLWLSKRFLFSSPILRGCYRSRLNVITIRLSMFSSPILRGCYRSNGVLFAIEPFRSSRPLFFGVVIDQIL